MALAETISTKAPFKRKAKSIESYVITITPEMAAEILAEEYPNRHKSIGTIDAYARRMAENKWKLNGEAVKFDKDGNLIDGQHRLEASVKSGMPFETLVVLGLPGDAQDTMDDPRRRSVNDQQALRGLNLPASASAAARWLLRLRLGSISHAKRATNAEVLDVLLKHKSIGESAVLLKDREHILLPSIAVVMHYVGTHLLMLPEKATSFVDVMTSGVPAYEGDPAHMWREKLIRAKTIGNGLPAVEQWNGTVHAWNLFTANATVKRFQIPEETMIENLDIRKI